MSDIRTVSNSHIIISMESYLRITYRMRNLATIPVDKVELSITYCTIQKTEDFKREFHLGALEMH